MHMKTEQQEGGRRAGEGAGGEGEAETDSSLTRQDCPALLPARPLKKRIGPYSFRMSEVLGRGFSSVVYLGRREGGGREAVALKVVELGGLSAHRRRLLEKEVRVLKALQHPHVLALVDVYYTAHNCYIITEYCEGGSLQGLIDAGLPFDWPRAAAQVASALCYLAERRVLHRDVKPANVLVKGGEFKLGDFGFAAELGEEERMREEYLIGSPLFMPPESLLHHVYSLRGDSFAFGVFLYYLCTRRFPWRGKDKEELTAQYARKGASQRPLEGLPPKLKHFLNGLLERQPEGRLPVWEVEAGVFGRARRVLGAERQLAGLAGHYAQQIRLCQFVHLLMVNFAEWQQVNPFLLPLLSQHLGQLVEVLGWGRQTHMRLLTDRYALPAGQFQFGSDHYHWLNNCLKDTLLALAPLPAAHPLLLKLLQYQGLLEGLMFGSAEEIWGGIEGLSLQERFVGAGVGGEELGALLGRVDFYEL